ncbi:hypothetical protein DdX_07685 [Ditylenchus destructor]|uniref:Uncharacterized protein n=1 Tax=Ditylenchus destructor TaxID=166010 RepID=A0AAD4N3F2_9BILA|nr:hypothetical protein DdX_07685 [Ditylenchus destructor]
MISNGKNGLYGIFLLSTSNIFTKCNAWYWGGAYYTTTPKTWEEYRLVGYDWGDFHVFAVIFFSFLIGVLLIGGLGAALYFVIGKPFFNRFRDQVRLVKTGRSAETKFPAMKPKPQPEYSNIAVRLPSGASNMYGRSQDQEPIIRSYPDQPTFRPSSQLGRLSSLERPTYFTPTPEKSLAPVREEIEEYRIVREESVLSALESEGHAGFAAKSPSVDGAGGPLRVVRATTATHTHKTLQRPNTYI